MINIHRYDYDEYIFHIQMVEKGLLYKIRNYVFTEYWFFSILCIIDEILEKHSFFKINNYRK